MSEGLTEEQEAKMEERMERVRGEIAILGTGPWVGEPDRLEWRYRGLPLLMLRNQMWNWCGYVGISPGHPWHGKTGDDVEVEVHGGLTYASECAGHICHVPRPGEPAEVWWLGFDCGHAFDFSPAMEAHFQARNPELVKRRGMKSELGELIKYRDVAYVRAECERLADQVIDAAGPGEVP